MYFLSKHFQTKHLSCSLQQYIYSVIWYFLDFFAFAVFFNPKDRNLLILHYSFSFSKLFNLFSEVFHQDFFVSEGFQFVSFIHAAFRIWKNNSFTTELCIAQEAFKYHALDRNIFSYLNLPYFSIFTILFTYFGSIINLYFQSKYLQLKSNYWDYFLALVASNNSASILMDVKSKPAF